MTSIEVAEKEARMTCAECVGEGPEHITHGGTMVAIENAENESNDTMITSSKPLFSELRKAAATAEIRARFGRMLMGGVDSTATKHRATINDRVMRNGRAEMASKAR